MGNTNTNTNKDGDICLVCWEKIHKRHILICNKCNIQMHLSCYKNYNIINKHTLCICPHCQRIGTLERKTLSRQFIFEKPTKIINLN
jgi:hypothetical protein